MASQAASTSTTIRIENEVSTPISTNQNTLTVNRYDDDIPYIAGISPVAYYQFNSDSLSCSQRTNANSLNIGSSSGSSSDDTLPIFSCTTSQHFKEISNSIEGPNINPHCNEENVASFCHSLENMSFHLKALTKMHQTLSSNVFTPNKNRLGTAPVVRSPTTQGGHSTAGISNLSNLSCPLSQGAAASSQDRFFSDILGKINSLNTALSSIEVRLKKLECLEDNLVSEIRTNNEKISSVDNKYENEVKSLHVQLDNSFSYVDTRMDLIFLAKAKEIDEHFDSLITHIDNEVVNCVDARMLELVKPSSSLPPNEDNISKSELDSKLSNLKEDLLPFCHSTINKFLEQKEVDIDFNAIAAEAFDRKFQDLITPSLTNIHNNHAKIATDIADLKSSLSLISDEETKTGRAPPSIKDILGLERKVYSFSNALAALQLDLDSKNKRLNNLDLKSRELNLLIDGMFELANEDTINYVCSLLSKFIPHFDRPWIDNAYRLGKPASNRAPRRILLTVSSILVKEKILEKAKFIADAGSPGSRIFINEDIPENIKRRRSDVYKYVDFLRTKGIKAIQKGDAVIFNNSLYRYEELIHMSDGFSLKDSRTTRKNGVLAFQSPHSPLSNLFVAPIKRNGIVFPSAEHAYQHAKAIFCKDHALAHSILANPCPYEAMATGKRVSINKDWQSKQLTIMEEILRLKLEQVPAFSDELKATECHYLVKNTRSPFWGSGTPYNSPSIFFRQFLGKNHLGKLLMHIRDNY